MAKMYQEPVSEIIRRELVEANREFHANDNISEFITPERLNSIQEEVEGHVQKMLHAMVIDTENDHNTQGTAKRVAKMFIREIYKGRYLDQPDITSFPNAKDLDDIYTLGPIAVRSTCSHHLVPIIGHAWVGIQAGKGVIGISKFHRIIDWIMSRPSIQEESTVMVADMLEELVEPVGCAVVIRSNHMCMSLRGVKAEQNSSMITSCVRGTFREDKSIKQEFMSLIKSQGF